MGNKVIRTDSNNKKFHPKSQLAMNIKYPISNCCSCEMPDWPDNDICPMCLEHSEPAEEELDEDEAAFNNDLLKADNYNKATKENQL